MSTTREDDPVSIGRILDMTNEPDLGSPPPKRRMHLFARMKAEMDAKDALIRVVNDGDDEDVPDFTAAARFVKRPRRYLRNEWDQAYLTKLRIEVAGERGLKQRAVLNVLLAEWIDLPADRRRRVKDKALAWEREMWP